MTMDVGALARKDLSWLVFLRKMLFNNETLWCMSVSSPAKTGSELRFLIIPKII